MNMFKPVMHSFSWTAAIFKSSQEHKGISRCLTQNTNRNSRIHGRNVKNGELTAVNKQKQKAVQSKLSSFFTLEKRQKSDNAGEEVQSPKTTPDLSTAIDLGASEKHKNNS